MSIESPEPSNAPDRDARMFAMLAHLTAFAGLAIPLGSIIGPLAVWLLKREDHALIDDQGKEALNFNISVFLYFIGCFLLSFVLIGIPMLIALVIFWLVMVVIASIKANSGERFRYPLNLRLIS